MTDTTQDLLARLRFNTMDTKNRDKARADACDAADWIAAAPELHRIAIEQAAKISRLMRQRNEARLEYARVSDVLSNFAHEWSASSAKQDAKIERLRCALERAAFVLAVMPDIALRVGLAGTSKWDEIAGGSDLFGALDQAHTALQVKP